MSAIRRELIRRASEGCEGPLDGGCWESNLPKHLWCDPCRCQEAAKLLASLHVALTDADRFITNGIEFGFIRMPDADCPDPAHQTPQAVKAALAEARK